MKPFIYLPSGYKRKTNTVIEGRSRTGEVSPKGLVAHTEDWEGRVAANAAPNSIHWIVDRGGLRAMTMVEQVNRGYFIPGRGPRGMRLVLR